MNTYDVIHEIGEKLMSKTKQSAVVFKPDEMAAFERQRENEKGLTLFELEARVKNLENTVRVLLEQVTDLSIQQDTIRLEILKHKESNSEDTGSETDPRRKNDRAGTGRPILKSWRAKVYTWLNQNHGKYTIAEIKDALKFEGNKETLKAALKYLHKYNLIDGELDEKSNVKRWWAIPNQNKATR